MRTLQASIVKSEGAGEANGATNGANALSNGAALAPKRPAPMLKRMSTMSSMVPAGMTSVEWKKMRNAMNPNLGKRIIGKAKDFDHICRWFFPLSYSLFLIIMFLSLQNYDEAVNCHKNPYY